MEGSADRLDRDVTTREAALASVLTKETRELEKEIKHRSDLKYIKDTPRVKQKQKQGLTRSTPYAWANSRDVPAHSRSYDNHPLDLLERSKVEERREAQFQSRALTATTQLEMSKDYVYMFYSTFADGTFSTHCSQVMSAVLKENYGDQSWPPSGQSFVPVLKMTRKLERSASGMPGGSSRAHQDSAGAAASMLGPLNQRLFVPRSWDNAGRATPNEFRSNNSLASYNPFDKHDSLNWKKTSYEVLYDPIGSVSIAGQRWKMYKMACRDEIITGGKMDWITRYNFVNQDDDRKQFVVEFRDLNRRDHLKKLSKQDIEQTITISTIVGNEEKPGAPYAVNDDYGCGRLGSGNRSKYGIKDQLFTKITQRDLATDQQDIETEKKLRRKRENISWKAGFKLDEWWRRKSTQGFSRWKLGSNARNNLVDLDFMTGGDKTQCVITADQSVKMSVENFLILWSVVRYGFDRMKNKGAAFRKLQEDA